MQQPEPLAASGPPHAVHRRAGQGGGSRRAGSPRRRRPCGCRKPMPPGDTHESRLRRVAPLDPELVQVTDAIGQRAQRRGLVQGAVRPVRVVKVLLLAQDGHQVALVPDQGPVQQLTPAAPDPAFHDRVHSRRLSASFHHHSRRDNPSSDTARETIMKISFKPTSRRSSHALAGQGPRPPRWCMKWPPRDLFP